MHNFYKMLLASAVCALTLTGCATDRVVGQATGVTVSTLSELPAPAQSQQYLVAPNDSLEITVSQVEMLTGTFLADSRGYISFPLIGDVYVEGKAPNQIAALIADRLRGNYIVDPQVRVRPMGTIQRSVSVGGEVAKPGTYPIATAHTLVRAINEAGGLDSYAKVDDVLLMRRVGEQSYIGVYNIEAIQRGNYPDPNVFHGDIITVGDSPGRRRLETILQFFPLISTSLLLLDRSVN